MKYCGQCSALLALVCPQCHSENPPGFKFCGHCAAALTPVLTESAASKSAITPPHSDGERRHLTVLFCDLVDSTALAAQMDPEDWRAAVAAYHRAAAEAITRYGGHVAKYLGDGLMAFFGYPEAHDNDAERAVRAGLALLDAIAKLSDDASHPRMEARVGIDSGAVVVGVGAGLEPDVFGDTPNIAARLQSAAEPGSVLVSSSTHDLVSGLFLVEDRGSQSLKGIAEGLRLYRVIRPSGARGRLEAAATSRGLTPFIGREDELRTLAHRWERARDGEGQAALIIGEAGIGKSRLLHRFRETISGNPHTWLDAAAGAFFQNSPFYPVTEMLRQSFGLSLPLSSENSSPSLPLSREDRLRLRSRPDLSPRTVQPENPELGGGSPPNERETESDAITRIADALRHAAIDPSLAVPLIAPLLNLTLPPEYPPSSLPPDQQRRKLLALLVEWIMGTARRQPLIIATEDLHWADPSTLELLQLLVEQGDAAPLFLLLTARPEFHPSWPLRAHHARITLNRLSTREIRSMVRQIAAQKALADETMTAVIDRTSGVPLFVEELTRAVLESGEGKLSGGAIPATLHDSLMARLDKLGPARETLQTGAVLGGEFSYELLRAVAQLEDNELQRHLRTLTDAELLYVRGIPPEAAYQFKHALIRDAAYQALLKTRRKELHLLVAQTIDTGFPAIKENHPEVLARHWTEAGEIENAIEAWTAAAKSAESRNAFQEARESYEQSLALINQLAASPDRDSRELELLQSVYAMLSVGFGYASPQTIDAAQRAATLADKLGNLAKLVGWVRSRGHYALLSGDYAAAKVHAQRTLELAIQEGSVTSLAAGHQLQMQVRYLCGEHLAADENYAAGRKFFGDPGFRKASPGFPIVAFAAASWNAWTLGHVDAARAREAEVWAVVDENNPFESAFANYLIAYLRVYLGKYPEAESLARKAIALADKHQFKYQLALSRCVCGLALAESGKAAEGVDLIQRGITGLTAIGTRSGLTRYMAFLAVAQERNGFVIDALETIGRAITISSSELAQRPETLRVRGELRLKLGQTDLAESGYREAIVLARSLSAKSWELRATTSLARLLRDTNRRDEARAMLANIYNWFTEGFDTLDLIDAKALLDELSQ
jgi:class 3 adenylate cyclase/tetratricopeptide (TPR) repeat protein